VDRAWCHEPGSGLLTSAEHGHALTHAFAVRSTSTQAQPVTTGLFQPSHLLGLPELGRSFGQGLRALKGGLDGHPDGADQPDGRTDKPDRFSAS
jgi:hypothetical protein